MYKHYNPNPHGKFVGDCIIRALTKIFDKSWDNIGLEYFIFAYNEKDMPSSNAVLKKFLKQNGYKKKLLPDECPECYTVDDFSNDFGLGKYIVGTGTHIIAIVNGIIYDSWDSRNEIPLYYFVKE